jgi:23S rRNA U2552 (ribose-2'-O)-methylase RlmE/FtsJ
VLEGQFDVLLSDMAPRTTGNRGADAEQSVELCQHALMVADQVLKPGKGTVLLKVFQGRLSPHPSSPTRWCRRQFPELLKLMKESYREVRADPCLLNRFGAGHLREATELAQE